MEKLLELARESNNDIIIITIVIIVDIILGFPIYKALIRAAKEKREYYSHEKQILLDVVKENTIAITKLTTFVEGDADRCKTFERSLEKTIDNMNDKVDSTHLLTNEIYNIVLEHLETKKKGSEQNGAT